VRLLGVARLQLGVDDGDHGVRLIGP
jgi:hypothetical protein